MVSFSGCAASQPSPSADQFFHLLVADGVVFAGVERGDEDVQVRQQVGQADGLGQRDREVGAVAPFGEMVVQGVRLQADLVAQRLETGGAGTRPHPGSAQPPDALPSGSGAFGQAGPVFAAPAQGRPEHLRQGHREERRGGVGAVVDVLRQRPPLAPRAPDQSDGVHVQQQGRRAGVVRDFRVEDVRLPERQFKRLRTGGVLVQQVAQIGGGVLSRANSQQHEALYLAGCCSTRNEARACRHAVEPEHPQRSARPGCRRL